MAKKSLFKKTAQDPVSEAAEEAVAMEIRREDAVSADRENRERLIARTHEMIGRIQTANMFGNMATVASWVWVQEVKDSEIYKDLPMVGTWKKFCEYIGFSEQHVSEKLNNLRTFGEEFMNMAERFRVGYRDLRKLRRLTCDGAVEVMEGAVTIGDETIPLDLDHAEDLQLAIERVIDEKDSELAATRQEANAEISAKEKVLEAKEDVIRRQEKEIGRLENRPRIVVPEEEAEFLEKVESWREGVNAWLAQFDPENAPLSANASPRMRAAMVEALGYFARMATGTFHAAQEVYGEPEVDDDYRPEYFGGPEATEPTNA